MAYSMSSSVVVDLFAEDHAHQAFLEPMIHRLARDLKLDVTLRVRSARGGHQRALGELKLYQRSVTKGFARLVRPDIVIVAIDANCSAHARARRDIAREIDRELRAITAIACPDPHIERWYLADPSSFAEVVGKEPRPGKRKCDRDTYKRILSDTVASAGHPVLLGGIEFAGEIVAAMDFYRAGRRERSLKHFIDEVQALLRVRSLDVRSTPSSHTGM